MWTTACTFYWNCFYVQYDFKLITLFQMAQILGQIVILINIPYKQ